MSQTASVPPETQAPRPQRQRTVLHIGWASAAPGRLHKQFTGPEWREIRLDPDPRVQPDIVSRIEKLEGVEDASVDAVYAPQLLQRFPTPSILFILKEFLRVLKDEGVLIVSVPNAQLAATFLANSQPDATLYETKLGPITPMDLLYGLRSGVARGEAHYQHRTCFTHELLGLGLRECGFTNIHVTRRGYEIIATAMKFPYDHPQRVERISMGGPSEVEAPPPPSVPAQAQAVKATGPAPLRRQPSDRADELDLPPGMWKPLGLKKA